MARGLPWGSPTNTCSLEKQMDWNPTGQTGTWGDQYPHYGLKGSIICMYM
uniref:Uncharacterized protein n=1 Tax=Anguilla anguilla TaxID=7936 RepID=A0A0E9V895_ANGAN